MSTWTDLKKNYVSIKNKKGKNFALLQCTSEYPNSLKKVGLNVITEMKKNLIVMLAYQIIQVLYFPQ